MVTTCPGLSDSRMQGATTGHIACKNGASSRQGRGRIPPAVDEFEIQNLEDELGIFGLYAVNGDRMGRATMLKWW